MRPRGSQQWHFLLVLRREWMGMGVAGMIIDSSCGSFPHSLRLAQVSNWRLSQDFSQATDRWKLGNGKPIEICGNYHLFGTLTTLISIFLG